MVSKSASDKIINSARTELAVKKEDKIRVLKPQGIRREPKKL
jgi:hypothetical protein